MSFRENSALKEFLQKIYLILTLDCEESAKITSQSLDRKLDWSEAVAAALHRMICGKSRRLHKQILEMNGSLEQAVENLEDAELSQSSKERIRKRLHSLDNE